MARIITELTPANDNKFAGGFEYEKRARNLCGFFFRGGDKCYKSEHNYNNSKVKLTYNLTKYAYWQPAIPRTYF